MPPSFVIRFTGLLLSRSIILIHELEELAIVYYPISGFQQDGDGGRGV